MAIGGELGQVAFHARETRTLPSDGNQTGTANCFYVSQLENKNALANAVVNATSPSQCLGGGDGNVPDPSGPNDAVGKVQSNHAHAIATFGESYGGDNSLILGAITLGDQYLHWLDYSYLAYLLSGDPYYLEESYQQASWMLTNMTNNYLTSNGFFAAMPASNAFERGAANAWRALARAGIIAPDGTAEASYFQSMMLSTLEVQEGAQGITGTPLTPSNLNCAGATCAYTASAANRWDWGRATVMSDCENNDGSTCTTVTPALHMATNGQCADPTTLASVDVDGSVATTFAGGFQWSELMVAAKEVREYGYPDGPVMDEWLRSYIERALDSTYNPYLLGEGYIGRKALPSSGTSCPTQNHDAFISSYATLRSASNHDATSFAEVDYPCTDHAYTLMARATLAFAQEYGTTSADPNCPSGTCQAAAAWAWMTSHAPYFSQPLAGDADIPCSTYDTVYGAQGDDQIKFAVVPRAP